MKKSDITQNEIVILNVIWERETATLRMIMDEICEKTLWSKHAIISFLKRMEHKGMIKVVSTSPVKQYAALVPKEATVKRETNSFLKNIYDGNLGLMVSNMVSTGEMSDDEIQELIDILESKRK